MSIRKWHFLSAGADSPQAGPRFHNLGVKLRDTPPRNPSKLLLDPYAKSVEGEVKWDEAVFPSYFGDPEGARNEKHSAPFRDSFGPKGVR